MGKEETIYLWEALVKGISSSLWGVNPHVVINRGRKLDLTVQLKVSSSPERWKNCGILELVRVSWNRLKSIAIDAFGEWIWVSAANLKPKEAGFGLVCITRGQSPIVCYSLIVEAEMFRANLYILCIQWPMLVFEDLFIIASSCFLLKSVAVGVVVTCYTWI